MTQTGRPQRGSSDWPRVGTFRFRARENEWEWSDEVARMHGYEPGTVTPTTELVLSHKHPDDKPTVADLIEQVRQYGVPFSSRHRIIDTNGNVHLVVVVGGRWYDDDGQVIGTTGFYIDITDEFDADVRQTLDEVVATIARNRAVINQAMGILMFTYGTSAETAFDAMASRSKQTNVKLRDIAARFVSAVTAASLLSPDVREQVDQILLTAHESAEHAV